MTDSLKSLLGDSFIDGKGQSFDSSALKDKYIGIYFSAHWCPPCRAFTPKFAQAYTTMKQNGKNFEVVFVSSDRDEDSFKEYMGEMPWIALPFPDKARKQALSKKYGVQGIPMLVILDPQGNVVTKSGREVIVKDPAGDNFPWAPKGVFECLGQEFVSKQGKTTLAQIQANSDAIGLYFSAHWCPPCRGFTPKLVETYNALKESGKKFEIIFISSDNDEESFAEYFAEMPWVALPFDARGRKEELSELYEVEGIPSLIILDAKSGKTIQSKGRSVVSRDPKGAEFPWLPRSLKNLDPEFFNSNACMLFLFEHATADASKSAQAVAQNVADHFAAQFKQKGDEQLMFMFVGAESNNDEKELCSRVRQFLGLNGDQTAPHVLIMDIPNEIKFICTKSSEQDLLAFVDDFLADKLSPSPLQ